MKLYVLDLGKIVMMTENPVTEEDGDEDASAIPVSAFLIDSPKGKLLFDTGCHPDAMKGAWPKAMCTNPYICDEEFTLLSRLKQINVKPEEIKYIVVSHLHLDHAGGLHFFPNAEVYVQENELIRTMDDYKNGESDIFHMECDIKNWEKVGINWKTVNSEESVEICSGVSIIDLKSGHSFGMLALRVELGCGTFLLVSDAAYCAYHYGPPARLTGAIYDERGYFKSIEAIRDMEEKYDAKIIFGHDMNQFKELIKSQNGFYE